MVEPPDRLRPVLGGGEQLAREGERVTGAGPKYHPYSLPQARELLQPMVRSVRERVAQMPDRLRGERVFIEATLLPNYLAASHHPTSLETDADLIVVGTRPARGVLRRPRSEKDAPTKTLILAATDRSLERLDALFTDAAVSGTLAEDLIKLQAVELPPEGRVAVSEPAVRTREVGIVPVWEAVLQPPVDTAGRFSQQAWDLVRARWFAFIESLEGEVHANFIRITGDLTFMPVSVPVERVRELAAFNPLRSLRRMPRLRRVRPQLRSVDLGGAVPSVPAGGPPADARIAAFDGGVDLNHPLLAPFTTETDLSGAPPEDTAVAHGTLVTSALLYGHMPVGRPLEAPPAHVDMFRIYPAPQGVPPDDEVYWVLDQIEHTLRASPARWRIVNLSYGPEAPVDDSLAPDRFTAVLDELAHELGIALTAAAGNDGLPTVSTLGEDRVQPPADGVNVIGVGACDDVPPSPVVRAEYSCVGPGRPGLRVQPLGVSFGGSDAQRFIGAGPGGSFEDATGTSFAAPVAARGLATLLSTVPFSANLARGLGAHFADGPAPRDLVAVGYGRLPDDYRPLLVCEPTEITVVVTDTIARGQTMAYPLPYPTGGLASGNVKLRWTISFTSPTDPSDSVEYTSAGLEVVFRPNAAVRVMNPPPGETGRARDVDLRSDAALIQQLTNENWRLSANPKSRSGRSIRSEQTLRDEGKWETVMRYEDGINVRGLHLPELWVTYFERERGQLVPHQAATPLAFVLVMSVSARTVTDLYDRVAVDPRFQVLAPLAVPLPVPAGQTQPST